MRTLVKIVIMAAFISNSSAQIMQQDFFKTVTAYNKQKSFKLEQKFVTWNDFNIGLSPQFGNLFLSRHEAKNVKINLKDYYNDFDFGFNIDLSQKLANSLDIKALYEIGMLKFNNSGNEKGESYIVKVVINYTF